ncbi:MAG: thioredoxin family protein [Muribaculaceae bacterium]|nr:thioredoxin family protein [Muribaculaceae bacterium]
MDTKLLEKLRDEKGVALVEMYASWCPHCRRMMPVVEDVKALLEGKVNVYQFDIDEYPDLADALGASSVPSFYIFDNGEQKWKYTGEIDGNVLVEKLQQYL